VVIFDQIVVIYQLMCELTQFWGRSSVRWRRRWCCQCRRLRKSLGGRTRNTRNLSALRRCPAVLTNWSWGLSSAEDSVVKLFDAWLLLWCWPLLTNLITAIVCRKKGLLLSFVYKFGRVARWCCLLPPKWHHFGPAILPPEWCHVLFTFRNN
jgi:hypothetical protein